MAITYLQPDESRALLNHLANVLASGWKPAQLQIAISLVRARSLLEVLAQPATPRVHLAAEERRALLVVIDGVTAAPDVDAALLAACRERLLAEARPDAELLEANRLATRARTRRAANGRGRARTA